MHATELAKPFHRDGWVYEEKYDGWRMVAEKAGRQVTLTSRNGLDHTPDGKNLEAARDSEMRKFIKNDLSRGLVIGVYKDGKSFIKGYGAVGKESTTVPGASTVFQIASLSNLFTASLLQILCDEGG